MTFAFFELIWSWRVQNPGNADAMLALRAKFLFHVRRATARYPDSYFEFCEKGPDSVEMLADELLVRCDREIVLRQPFLGREPFTAYLKDHTEDSQVRFHTFYGRFSLLMDLLKRTRARNLRLDARARDQAVLWTQVGLALPQVGEHTGRRAGRYPIWRAKPAQEGTEIWSADSLEARVFGALRALGEATQARVVQHLRPAGTQDPTPTRAAPAPADPSEGHVTRTAVRAAVQRAWDSFDAVDRDVMFATMSGSPLEDLALQRAELLRRSELTRLFIRLDDRLRAELAVEMDFPVPARASRKDNPEAVLPQELGRLIFEVLCEIVPAWHTRKKTRDAFSLQMHSPIPAPPSAPALAVPIDEEDIRDCLLLWDALFHPEVARDIGLAGNLLTSIGAAAWASDPARALAEAEYDEGLYVDEDLAEWDDEDGSCSS